MTGEGEDALKNYPKEQRTLLFRFDGNQHTGDAFAACMGHVLGRDATTKQDTAIPTRVKYFNRNTPPNMRAVFDTCVTTRAIVVIYNARVVEDTRAGAGEYTIFSSGTAFGLPTRNTKYGKALLDAININFTSGVDRPRQWLQRLTSPLPHPPDNVEFNCTMKLLPTLDPRIEAGVKPACRDTTIIGPSDNLVCSEGHPQPTRTNVQMFKKLNALPVLLRTTDDQTYIAAIADPDVASKLDITEDLGDPEYEPADLAGIMREHTETFTIKATTRHIKGTTYLIAVERRENHG